MCQNYFTYIITHNLGYAICEIPFDLLFQISCNSHILRANSFKKFQMTSNVVHDHMQNTALLFSISYSTLKFQFGLLDLSFRLCKCLGIQIKKYFVFPVLVKMYNMAILNLKNHYSNEWSRERYWWLWEWHRWFWQEFRCYKQTQQWLWNKNIDGHNIFIISD